eukprot:10080225-Alexandrium_andersonii.AAC.1
MITVAIEQVKQALNAAKPPLQSVAHYSKMVETTEAKLLKVEEELDRLNAKRNDLLAQRQLNAKEL